LLLLLPFFIRLAVVVPPAAREAVGGVCLSGPFGGGLLFAVVLVVVRPGVAGGGLRLVLRCDLGCWAVGGGGRGGIGSVGIVAQALEGESSEGMLSSTVFQACLFYYSDMFCGCRGGVSFDDGFGAGCS
jgi:hypothetical protein